ncbi:hypothetical protein EDD22DRAFT_907214 [Suillus occidentalis]|nr:hypothetical protein EDD22DRAFT_907214 [Suillus occidentalis]
MLNISLQRNATKIRNACRARLLAKLGSSLIQRCGVFGIVNIYILTRGDPRGLLSLVLFWSSFSGVVLTLSRGYVTIRLCPAHMTALTTKKRKSSRCKRW